MILKPGATREDAWQAQWDELDDLHDVEPVTTTECVLALRHDLELLDIEADERGPDGDSVRCAHWAVTPLGGCRWCGGETTNG